MQSFNRILIVNPFGIGDVLFTTPLIAMLKEQFPTVSVSYLGNARTVPFLKNDPRIDKVFCYERDEFVIEYQRSPWAFFRRWQGLAREIRVEGFDLAFDLSLSAPLGLMLVWAGVRERVGFNYKGRGRFLTRSLPLKGYEGRHVVEYYLDLLGLITREKRAGSGGKDADVRIASSVHSCFLHCAPYHSMAIFSSSEDESWGEEYLRAQGLRANGFVCLFPGGGASWGTSADKKRWPAENWAKLADKIIENSDLVAILMGHVGEKELCAAVAAGMKRRPVILAGGSTLTQSAALLKRARFVIANDGGPLHVAVAAGVRTVSVFGPVDPVVYGPFPRGEHHVVQKGLSCQPCYRNFRMSRCGHLNCLKILTVSEVFQEVKELL